MKPGLYRATIVVAGTLALSVALQNSPVEDLLVESALTGGGLWAGATASVADFGRHAGTMR